MQQGKNKGVDGDKTEIVQNKDNDFKDEFIDGDYEDYSVDGEIVDPPYVDEDEEDLDEELDEDADSEEDDTDSEEEDADSEEEDTDSEDEDADSEDEDADSEDEDAGEIVYDKKDFYESDMDLYEKFLSTLYVTFIINDIDYKLVTSDPAYYFDGHEVGESIVVDSVTEESIVRTDGVNLQI